MASPASEAAQAVTAAFVEAQALAFAAATHGTSVPAAAPVAGCVLVLAEQAAREDASPAAQVLLLRAAEDDTVPNCGLRVESSDFPAPARCDSQAADFLAARRPPAASATSASPSCYPRWAE